jgi:hypothetical protein
MLERGSFSPTQNISVGGVIEVNSVNIPAEVVVASAIIGPGGGNLSCDQGRVLVAVPDGALEKEVTVTCEIASTAELPGL